MPGATTSGALNRAVHRYRSAPLVARLFVHGRAFLSDLAFVERLVPRNGFIVDLGCGHGLFACLLREASAGRRVLGIDLDPKKIDAVTIIDVLYLLPFEEQEQVLRNAASALGEGGPLIVKAQERRMDPRYALTYAQEIITVTVLRATRGGRERFFFPDRMRAIAMFERAGFVVEVVEMPRRPYTDVVYLARKAPPRGPAAP